MDLKPVLYIIGFLLCILAASMVFPMLSDIFSQSDNWKVFMLCIVISGFFGGSLMLSNTINTFNLSLRQAFLLTVISWVSITIFAALPFRLCAALDMSYTDSFFEAMSGLTTTGSTVITSLDNTPNGILLWRSILQWLGGIGVILMALSILPFLRVGGMQFFRADLSKGDGNKAMPRTTQIAISIGFIYMALTALCLLSYMGAGLSPFDALNHAMSTLSTGGFSTHNQSFIFLKNPVAEIIAIVFMVIGGLPFILFLKTLQGRHKSLLRDAQVQGFLSILFVSALMTTLYLMLSYNIPFLTSLRHGTFNVVSIMTGTGFTNSDHNVWGSFITSLFFFLMFVGGCAGSTTCGIKIFRFQILYAVVQTQIKKLFYPHGAFSARYNDQTLSDDITMSVMAFFFVYALCFCGIAMALSFIGLDFITAVSSAATSLSNVGIGLGEMTGSANSSFTAFPDSAKWVMSAGMLLGRLEIFPVLVMFSPHFWRR